MDNESEFERIMHLGFGYFITYICFWIFLIGSIALMEITILYELLKWIK